MKVHRHTKTAIGNSAFKAWLRVQKHSVIN